MGETVALYKRSCRRVVGGRISLPQHVGKGARQSADGNRAEPLAVIKLQAALCDTAETVRFFQYRVEHWREVAGRGIDDLQDFSGRGLLLQRLARLGQEPRILDRDHRLVGKRTDQFDLPLGKRLDP